MSIIHMIIGTILTAIAVYLDKLDVIDGTRHNYTQHLKDKHWQLKRLPDWSLFGVYFMRRYNNMRDGVVGDKRGWYAKEKGESKIRQIIWNGIRNPDNTGKRLFNAIDIADCKTRVEKGYLEHVDEDSESTWGEKLVIAVDSNGKEYKSYESMKPLRIFGWFTGYCIRRLEGYKFDFGEEKIPFPDSKSKMTFEFYRDQCEQYAKDGYKKGQAMINLDRLAPKTGRKRWMFTLEKVKFKS